MAFCSNCGVKLSESARFCTSCGKPVPVLKTDLPVVMINEELITAPTAVEEKQNEAALAIDVQEMLADATVEEINVAATVEDMQTVDVPSEETIAVEERPRFQEYKPKLEEPPKYIESLHPDPVIIPVESHQTIRQKQFHPEMLSDNKTDMQSSVQSEMLQQDQLNNNIQQSSQNLSPQNPSQFVPPMQEIQPAPGSPFAVVGIGGYLLTLLLFAIPVVGLIICIVWACGGTKNCNRKNFARACLILLAICIFATIIFFIVTYISFVQISGGTGGMNGGMYDFIIDLLDKLM